MQTFYQTSFFFSMCFCLIVALSQKHCVIRFRHFASVSFASVRKNEFKILLNFLLFLFEFFFFFFLFIYLRSLFRFEIILDIKQFFNIFVFCCYSHCFFCDKLLLHFFDLQLFFVKNFL